MIDKEELFPYIFVLRSLLAKNLFTNGADEKINKLKYEILPGYNKKKERLENIPEAYPAANSKDQKE
ncbi:hypothetical protein PPACK8108_LOCUS9334 [Phakopsora pachyrhizi]|uniref:Site-specific DNA-methyltransferase (adenine-specific) n=1 Tax=Phakopsora pachyrhizi TaxID=170000 RepID=A0AAV0B0Z0_PHAPC|nr:hypothetical protein PPACK8108_LOCUS9334 [Phakopsora pachyrhizi]